MLVHRTVAAVLLNATAADDVRYALGTVQAEPPAAPSGEGAPGDAGGTADAASGALTATDGHILLRAARGVAATPAGELPEDRRAIGARPWSGLIPAGLLARAAKAVKGRTATPIEDCLAIAQNGSASVVAQSGRIGTLVTQEADEVEGRFPETERLIAAAPDPKAPDTLNVILGQGVLERLVKAVAAAGGPGRDIRGGTLRLSFDLARHRARIERLAAVERAREDVYAGEGGADAEREGGAGETDPVPLSSGVYEDAITVRIEGTTLRDAIGAPVTGVVMPMAE